MNPSPSTLPVEVRTRLGEELAADLEGAYQALIGRGWTPDAARERARQLIVPDAEALGRIAGVHRPLYGRLAARFGDTSVHRGERLAVVAVTAVSLILVGAPLLRAELFASPSAFLPPVLLGGSVTIAAVLAKAFHLFVKRPSTLPALRAGLAAPIAAAGLTLLAAFCGALVDTYRFAARVETTAPTGSTEVVSFLGDTAALLAVALAFSLAGALGWFLLLHRVVAAEAAASATPLPPLLSEVLP